MQSLYFVYLLRNGIANTLFGENFVFTWSSHPCAHFRHPISYLHTRPFLKHGCGHLPIKQQRQDLTLCTKALSCWNMFWLNPLVHMRRNCNTKSYKDIYPYIGEGPHIGVMVGCLQTFHHIVHVCLSCCYCTAQKDPQKGNINHF